MSTDENNSQNDKAEEPETVRFFESFEEMNRYDYHSYARMTPEERLQTVLTIRNRVWPEESSSKTSVLHVHIKDDGNNL